MKFENIQKFLDSDTVIDFCGVGSRHTVVPAVTDTDNDILVYVHGDCLELEIQGFTDCGNEYGHELVLDSDDEFVYTRKIVRDELNNNLIITHNRDCYDHFLTAAWFCRQFNVKDKQMRALLHQAFRRETMITIETKGASLNERVVAPLVSEFGSAVNDFDDTLFD